MLSEEHKKVFTETTPKLIQLQKNILMIFGNIAAEEHVKFRDLIV